MQVVLGAVAVPTDQQRYLHAGAAVPTLMPEKTTSVRYQNHLTVTAIEPSETIE